MLLVDLLFDEIDDFCLLAFDFHLVGFVVFVEHDEAMHQWIVRLDA